MTERYVEFVMDDIGCPRHLKGYDQLKEVIIRQINYPSENITISYKMVAGEYETTWSRIERNIRNLVEWILDNCDHLKIYNYFGNSLPMEGGITNKHFIITLAVAAKRIGREGNYVKHKR
jgi:hypothetical protein